jgi:prepilin-type N-terminal cleavage/methylation domain-containing protein
MKKHNRKGFTLIELIIVLALFSIVMYSVVRLIDPVTKFFVRSSNFENTSACVDNMKRCIEGNLKYANRVRAYSGFSPYTYTTVNEIETSSYDPTADLTANVQSFYNEFFLDRKFLDSSGTIYVLVFDNTQIIPDGIFDVTPPHAGSTGLHKFSMLSDIADNQLNSGKIVLYEYSFNNYGSGLDMTPTVTPWYVNQKLYGAFEYHFTLGSFAAAATTSTSAGGGGGTPVSTFDPSDCTITITMNEIRKDSTGLVRQENYESQTASFAMKNVLDATKKYTTPLADYITKESATYTSVADKYYVDPTPIPRYTALNRYSGADAFDGFYFIFTLAETTNDYVDNSGNAVDQSYISVINSMYPQ